MDESQQFKVVVNPEEQYSIWPAGRENAPGWSDAGKRGSKEECLAHMRRVDGHAAAQPPEAMEARSPAPRLFFFRPAP